MSFVAGIHSELTGEPVSPAREGRLPHGDYPVVRYRIDDLRAQVDRDALSAGPASLWRYAALLPVDDPSTAVTLGEGWTPLLEAPALGRHLGLANLLVKDEGRNPTGTFKDRGASVSLTRLRERGVETVVHNSSGNAAAAWGLYAARAGMRCTNLVPDDVLPASLVQSTLSGAATLVLDGPWSGAGSLVDEAVGKDGACDVRTLREPFRLEGKKTMGLEIAEQLGWQLPDVLVYPTGGGLGAIAIYKAFEELQSLGWVPPGPLPKLVLSQYSGCAPIVRAFEQGAALSEPWNDLDVPPGGLKSVWPPGDRKVLDLVRVTGGTAVAVSEEEAMEMTGLTCALEGLFPCPESATALAALGEARRRAVVDAADRIVVVLTGHGLKSIPLLGAPGVTRVRPGQSLDATAEGV